MAKKRGTKAGKGVKSMALRSVEDARGKSVRGGDKSRGKIHMSDMRFIKRIDGVSVTLK